MTLNLILDKVCPKDNIENVDKNSMQINYNIHKVDTEYSRTDGKAGDDETVIRESSEFSLWKITKNEEKAFKADTLYW